jgi:hypothetical protein
MNNDPRLTRPDISLIKYVTSSNKQRFKELVDYGLWDDAGNGEFIVTGFRNFDKGNALQRANAKRQRDKRAKEKAERLNAAREQSHGTRDSGSPTPGPENSGGPAPKGVRGRPFVGAEAGS